MAKQEVWRPLLSFDMMPSKTFFWLDKAKAHCFTLPKETNYSYINFFGLGKKKLQHKVTFLINEKRYYADLRLVQQNRSKVRKLRKEDLPERIVLQLGWKKYEMTQFAMGDNLRKAREIIQNGGENKVFKVRFNHLKDDLFLIQFLPSKEDRFARFVGDRGKI